MGCRNSRLLVGLMWRSRPFSTRLSGGRSSRSLLRSLEGMQLHRMKYTQTGAILPDYFLHRETLVSVFLLIDISIPAKQIDLEYASWLGQNQIPMTLVFTKCDKRKKKRNGGKRAEENVEDFQNLIRELSEFDYRLQLCIQIMIYFLGFLLN